jgi:LAO/AO transport system kinase
MLSLGERRAEGDWTPPIVKAVASRGEGIDDLLAALDAHHEWLVSSGDLARRRRARAAEEVEAIAVAGLRRRMGDLRDGTRLLDLAGRVVGGELDPFAAADELVAGLLAPR